jgi:septal ring factor EnvC (AmiA/AmiB activator)
VADEEKEVTDELEALQKELENMRQEKERLDDELKARAANMGELEETLAARDAEIAGLKQTITEAEEKLTQINDSLSRTVASYRELVVAAHPKIPPELITGDSVESVDESLQSAQALVEKVKQGIEAEMAKTRVPAGAPQRAPLDLSVLSPREKIEYAIGGSSSRR